MFSSLCISGFLQFLQTAVFTVGYISKISPLAPRIVDTGLIKTKPITAKIIPKIKVT